MFRYPRFDEIIWFIKEGIAPSKCVGCHQVGTWLCANCAGQILFLQVQNCYRCGQLSPRGRTCDRCRRHTALAGVVIATHFEAGPVRELVHELKYGGIIELAGLMGAAVAQAVLANKLTDLMLVPVPLHRERLAERGFNQSELLVQQVAVRTMMDYRLALARKRSTASQTKLIRWERLQNVKDAFVCRELVAGMSVLLVDDVMTTGATLEECAAVLKQAGAKRVWAAVVARG